MSPHIVWAQPSQWFRIFSSAFVHGAEEQATVQLDLPPGPGSYLLVPCTFYPGQECNFTLTLYHTDPELKLMPLKGARLG